jgi:peptidyl-prolyl cis-trans isomerase D
MAKRETQIRRAPTRKQIARSRKEREQLRLIYIGLGIVIALVIVVLGIGIFQTYVFEPNSPIATVNGMPITTRDYQTRVRYERFILDSQLRQIEAQRNSLLAQSEDEQVTQFWLSQLEQQGNQIGQQRAIVNRQTLDIMIEDKLIEAEAARRGITVSEEELTESINRFLAAQLGGLTAAAASETATARVEASATAALWTPTPTFTPSPTLTTTEEITQPTVTPANTSTPAPTPTLNVIEQSALSTQYTEWLNILAENADVGEAEFRRIERASILRDKVQEALGSEVPTSAEQSHARHILVETEEEANEVIERLKAGEDFAELAKELSTDPGSSARGGDLGFVPRGRFVAPIDEAIFSLPIGQVSEPVESDYGWHVIEVLEREVRELSPADYRISQRLAYDEWLTNAREEATIEDFWSIEKVPEDPLQQQFQFPQVPPGS